MDFREYLKKQEAVSLSYIARKMWPMNDNAIVYLSAKLNGKHKPWTEKDNKRAKEILNELGADLSKLGEPPTVSPKTP